MNNLTENQKKKRAVIYCRVSSDRQVENYSLETQEKICSEYAERNNFEVVEKFIEEGESAKTADRTKLQELLKHCYNKSNNIQIVIFHKIDRFARDRFDYDTVCYGLRAKGITIHSATEPIAENPTGRLMEGVLASFAQFDNEIRTERSVLGMKAALKEGRFIWVAPVGYDNALVNGKGSIVPNKKADLVRKSFEEVAKNLEPIEIIYKSKIKEGLTGRTGKPLSRSQFHKMILNQLYCGLVRGFGETFEGSFQPIISKELFKQVQNVLKYRRRKNYSAYQIKNPDFPLRRLLVHPTGAKITGAWAQGSTKKYPYYRYLSPNMTFAKDFLEIKFTEYLNSFKLEKEKISDLKSKSNYYYSERKKNGKNYRVKITKQIEEQELMLDHVFTEKEKGRISEFIFNKQIETIEKRLIALQYELSNTSATDDNFMEILNFISNYLESPGEVWKNANSAAKLKIQWFEFPDGVVFDGKQFRTKEIRSIYKLKSAILALNSDVVTPINEITNGGAISEGNSNLGNLKTELLELKNILEDKCK